MNDYIAIASLLSTSNSRDPQKFNVSSALLAASSAYSRVDAALQPNLVWVCGADIGAAVLDVVFGLVWVRERDDPGLFPGLSDINYIKTR